MNKLKKLAELLLALSLFTGVLAGCGSNSANLNSNENPNQIAQKEPDKITVQSLWLPQGQFAGLYVAKELGFYEDEGIDVTILPGGTDVSSEEQVENDVAQVGVAFYSSVLTYQEGGYDFINVFQTFKESPQYLVAKAGSGITSGKDLKGKKVGSWFGGRQYEFYALAQKYGYDIQKDINWVQQDYTMDQFISGEIDVASAMSYNEYLLLLENFKEEEINVIDMNKEGVAMLEDCLFVKRSWAEKNRDLLVRFLRATIKGWKYTAENPEKAAEIVHEIGQTSSLQHQINMIKKVIEFVIPKGSDSDKIGYLDREKIQQTIDLGFNTGLIKNKIDIDKSIDSSYWEEAIRGIK
ncbi:MAG: ABC transporter substrate-binding protein [Clostridiaceae bacterium]|nr:ABC transporter substrate-binding protein [Clostridiaceae bacterium]